MSLALSPHRAPVDCNVDFTQHCLGGHLRRGCLPVDLFEFAQKVRSGLSVSTVQRDVCSPSYPFGAGATFIFLSPPIFSLDPALLFRFVC